MCLKDRSFSLHSFPPLKSLTWLVIGIGIVFSPIPSGTVSAQEDRETGKGQWACEPTPADSLGPFYEPNAPVRSSVGTGYVLWGEVKSAPDCSPIPGAEIEFWLAGPDGRYDAAHRATVRPDASGRYRFESNYPPSYGSRPPHIHIRVAAEGYETLVTQHYPEHGETEGRFDLVLVARAS